MKLRYFSHSACQITTNSGKVILIDPFLDENPTSPVKSKDMKPDYIILTHAHGDHLGDAMKIAEGSKPLFICVFELSNYLSAKGYKTHGMSIGGGHNFDFGRVKFTIAHHGSSAPDGTYCGEPAGVLLFIDGKTLYHTGDTALFYDMKLIGEMNPVDLMLLPIGDNFTMDVRDAVKAVELTNPKVAIPIHYKTFPLIEADPREFKKKLEEKGKECRILDFGQEIEV